MEAKIIFESITLAWRSYLSHVYRPPLSKGLGLGSTGWGKKAFKILKENMKLGLPIVIVTDLVVYIWSNLDKFEV